MSGREARACVSENIWRPGCFERRMLAENGEDCLCQAMKLYLLRHAHAVEGAEDSSRPLSQRGLGTLRKVAAFVRATKRLRAMPVWHSPLLRSQQSAQLFKTELGWKSAKLVKHLGLLPEDNPARLLPVIARQGGDLVIVGHEPQLSALASLLLTGHVAPVFFKFKKGALLCLENVGHKHPHWRVRWHLSPELLMPKSRE